MTLIISSEDDLSTNDVIDWMLHYNMPFVRINGTTNISVTSIEINNENIVDVELILDDNYNKNRQLKLSSIQSVWYRRGGINVNMLKPVINCLDDNEMNQLREYLKNEKRELEFVIYALLKKKKHINTFHDDDRNKLHTLMIAKECGLKIPDTIITSFQEKYTSMSAKHKSLITKGIRHGCVTFKDKILGGGTCLIDLSTQHNLPNYFFPSLLQENLKKKYEIRSFYIHGNFYSIAIFSQLDEQTSIDFRNYNEKKPNRTPPFEIPLDIQQRLKLLMNKLDINCGSIDIIVTTDNEFVFLEVNPVGQFTQVSIPGNFFLEKQITNFLRND